MSEKLFSDQRGNLCGGGSCLSATPPSKDQGPSASQFWGTPMPTSFDQIRRGNTYGEGRVLRVSQAIAYCTNASHRGSAIAEFLLSCNTVHTVIVLLMHCVGWNFWYCISWVCAAVDGTCRLCLQVDWERGKKLGFWWNCDHNRHVMNVYWKAWFLTVNSVFFCFCFRCNWSEMFYV